MSRYLGFPANNTKPFIFVSYTSEDAERIIPIVNQIRERGYNVWYDDGIELTEKWEATLYQRIDDCELVIMFVSENSILKEGSYIFKEFREAKIRYEKDVFVILLSDAKSFQTNKKIPKEYIGPLEDVLECQCANFCSENDYDREFEKLCNHLSKRGLDGRFDFVQVADKFQSDISKAVMDTMSSGFESMNNDEMAAILKGISALTIESNKMADFLRNLDLETLKYEGDVHGFLAKMGFLSFLEKTMEPFGFQFEHKKGVFTRIYLPVLKNRELNFWLYTDVIIDDISGITVSLVGDSKLNGFKNDIFYETCKKHRDSGLKSGSRYCLILKENIGIDQMEPVLSTLLERYMGKTSEVIDDYFSRLNNAIEIDAQGQN